MLRRVSLMTSRANRPIRRARTTPATNIINPKIIGNWLTSVCGRIHNGMRIELVKGSRAHGNKYTLITVADPQKG